MPTYTFKCEKCEKEVEYIQSMISTSKTLFRLCTCDSNMHTFTKVIKPTPVHFKGSGWVDKD